MYGPGDEASLQQATPSSKVEVKIDTSLFILPNPLLQSVFAWWRRLCPLRMEEEKPSKEPGKTPSESTRRRRARKWRKRESE